MPSVDNSQSGDKYYRTIILIKFLSLSFTLEENSVKRTKTLWSFMKLIWRLHGMKLKNLYLYCNRSLFYIRSPKLHIWNINIRRSFWASLRMILWRHEMWVVTNGMVFTHRSSIDLFWYKENVCFIEASIDVSILSWKKKLETLISIDVPIFPILSLDALSQPIALFVSPQWYSICKKDAETRTSLGWMCFCYKILGLHSSLFLTDCAHTKGLTPTFVLYTWWLSP